MRSPFPGIDPFIEGQKWHDFHTTLNVEMRTYLTRQLAPRYVVAVEDTLILERDDEKQVRFPDVSISEGFSELPWNARGGGTATAVAIEPTVYTLPKTEPRRQRYLEIREREGHRLVTVIEILSPANKNEGYREYLSKRAQLLAQPIHLVEMDLLRGGRRLPTVEPLHPADYYVFVSRSEARPQVEGFGWPLAHVAPSIPIPLLPEDGQIVIPLQEILDVVYDRAGYGYSLDYRVPVMPSLSERETAWVAKLLSERVTPIIGATGQP